jgi:hypothetical protein
MLISQRRTDVTHGNPIISKLETEKNLQKHRASLKNIKASIDNRPPAPMKHLTENGRDYLQKKSEFFFPNLFRENIRK